MEIMTVISNNNAKIFRQILQQERFAEKLSNTKLIYVPTDNVINYVLKLTNLSLEQFANSPDFYKIILNHIDSNSQKQFPVIGNKSIDKIPISEQIDVNGTKLSFIRGLLITKQQRDDLRTLSTLLAKCPKLTCPEIATKCNDNNNQNYDKFGYDIFSIFNLKYMKADKIFEKAANKILSLFQQKLLTTKDRADLVNVLDLYSEAYTRFVDQIVTQRTFTPKASSGQKPIPIKSAKDWAEAIIEFNDLVTKFEQALDLNIRDKTNKDKLKKNCESLDVKKCEYPCSVKKGLIKNSCSYK